MKLAIASDHRGWLLKQRLTSTLEAAGHSLLDLGTNGDESVDYPDFALQVAQRVVDGEVERGILICGSGIGMSIAANKVPGVRAAVCQNVELGILSRQHNDANIICLSADHVDEVTNVLIVEAWMTAEFEGGRHAHRVEKIQQIEQRAPA